MREIIRFATADCTPSKAAVLAPQGMDSAKQPSAKVLELLDEALVPFGHLASARGVIADISESEFAEVYQGEGQSEPDTPLAGIFPRAEYLALFAVTVGAEVSQAITGLFDQGRGDLGYLLDAVASSATEQTANRIEEHFAATLLARTTAEVAILRYSPGYCGWHITGQKRLFKYLHPEEIGITLRPSCLMEPLKSVSGVIVAGKPDIHVFDDSYPFCGACSTHECHERIAKVRNPQ